MRTILTFKVFNIAVLCSFNLDTKKQNYAYIKKNVGM